MRIMLTMANIVQMIISEVAHSVYEIYSVFKLLQIAVCSAHFDYFEISTPVTRIMLTIANIV